MSINNNEANRINEQRINSNKKVWWICSKCGKEWNSTIAHRRFRGCPWCKATENNKKNNDGED